MATLKEMKNLTRLIFTDFKCTKSLRVLLADLSVFKKLTALDIRKYLPKVGDVVDFSEYFENIRHLAVHDTHPRSVMNYKNQIQTLKLHNSNYQENQKLHLNYVILIAHNAAALRKLDIREKYGAPFMYYIDFAQTMIVIPKLQELYIEHYSADGDLSYYQLTPHARYDNDGIEFVGKRMKLLLRNFGTFVKNVAKFELLEQIRIEHFDIAVFGEITREMLSFLKNFTAKHSELQCLNIRMKDDPALMPTIWILINDNLQDVYEFSLVETNGRDGKNDYIKKNVGVVQPFLNISIESDQFYEFLPNEQNIQFILLNANADVVDKYAEWLSELTAVKTLIITDTNSDLLVRAFHRLWINRAISSKAWDRLETIQANFKASDLDKIQLLAHFKSLQKIVLVFGDANDAKHVQKRGFHGLLWNQGVIHPDKPNIVEFTKIPQSIISNLGWSD